MTCIIHPSNFASKAKLQDRLNLTSGAVRIEDPSFFAPRSFLAKEMAVGQEEIVTNHPLRTKFAKVKRVGEAEWKVS